MIGTAITDDQVARLSLCSDVYLRSLAYRARGEDRWKWCDTTIEQRAHLAEMTTSEARAECARVLAEAEVQR